VDAEGHERAAARERGVVGPRRQPAAPEQEQGADEVGRREADEQPDDVRARRLREGHRDDPDRGAGEEQDR
jgi:hypothetical protein